MSYRQDLDEMNIDTIAKELMRRVDAQVRGVCDYCGRKPDTPTCKFPERHGLVISALEQIVITPTLTAFVQRTSTRFMRNEEEGCR